MQCEYFALQTYPLALITGLDLSPYFLAVDYRPSSVMLKSTGFMQQESTGLPAGSFDLVSTFLMCHELPQGNAADFTLCATFAASGWMAIMDMNPQSEVYAKMPPTF